MHRPRRRLPSVRRLVCAADAALSSHPGIAVLAAPVSRIAGLRINPASTGRTYQGALTSLVS